MFFQMKVYYILQVPYIFPAISDPCSYKPARADVMILQENILRDKRSGRSGKVRGEKEDMEIIFAEGLSGLSASSYSAIL